MGVGLLVFLVGGLVWVEKATTEYSVVGEEGIEEYRAELNWLMHGYACV